MRNEHWHYSMQIEGWPSGASESHPGAIASGEGVSWVYQPRVSPKSIQSMSSNHYQMILTLTRFLNVSSKHFFHSGICLYHSSMIEMLQSTSSFTSVDTNLRAMFTTFLWMSSTLWWETYVSSGKTRVCNAWMTSEASLRTVFASCDESSAYNALVRLCNARECITLVRGVNDASSGIVHRY